MSDDDLDFANADSRYEINNNGGHQNLIIIKAKEKKKESCGCSEHSDKDNHHYNFVP